MIRQFFIILIISLTVLNSFGQTHTSLKKADHYKTNNFDVAIFPADFYIFMEGQLFTPTRNEIDKAEVALNNDLKNLNRDLINQSSSPIIHKNLSKYRRQYFGYIDKNGDHILLINCFWFENKNEKKEWLTDRIMVHDGGSYYWNIKFNLDKGELFDLNVNGYA